MRLIHLIGLGHLSRDEMNYELELSGPFLLTARGVQDSRLRLRQQGGK